MGNPFVLKLEHGARLTDDDREMLEAICANARRVPAYTDLIQEGDNPRNVHLSLKASFAATRFSKTESGRLWRSSSPGTFATCMYISWAKWITASEP